MNTILNNYSSYNITTILGFNDIVGTVILLFDKLLFLSFTLFENRCFNVCNMVR